MPTLDEFGKVEQPFIDQLVGLSWSYLPGDIDVPYLTERESFRQVLLVDRLRQAIRRLNLDDDGRPWLDDARVNQAAGALEHLVAAHKLMEANQQATDLLLRGAALEGDPVRHGGRDTVVRYIDFDHPERNEFLAVNQFRVDPPWTVSDRGFVVPDVVLFVNGIPLVVVECKSPTATNPMEEGITQLLRYSNQRDWVESDEGAERLFQYNQLMVATFFYEARVGTIGASYEHYMEWKDTSPVPIAEVARDLGVPQLSSQQTLVAGMLRPAHLLDIVRNFILFQQADGQTIKIATRYHQFRAVHEAVRRLQHNKTEQQDGAVDRRGGVLWHTQGSGKSVTMVFLVRKMRTLPRLRRFKVVVVTDRLDLQKQLGDTAALTGETVRPSERDARAGESATAQIRRILSEDGPDLVFATVQKFQEHDADADVIELPPVLAGRRLAKTADAGTDYGPDAKVLQFRVQNPEDFPVLNESEAILLLVDEAHRSHTSQLHAQLMHSLPNCAAIGFTGTPIMKGSQTDTARIFGSFIDRYTIRQSEADGATVPILYEGRTTDAAVKDGVTLDKVFEDMFVERTPEELEAIQARYATSGHVLEAEKLIAAKARDLFRHYVATVMPNGFKAQVVAVSRLAAVRYHKALVAARDELVAELERLAAELLRLSEEELDRRDPDEQFWVRAYPYLDLIRHLEFATVMSGSHNQDPDWNQWTEKAQTDGYITCFKRSLGHPATDRQDPLAFLCVKSMLLTGFDAAVEQALYLDRPMRGHELLQAIARVNRTRTDKSHGLVVDYCGVARHLKEALDVYNSEDVDGALGDIRDELPLLDERYRRVLAVFHDRGILDISDVDACVNLLRDTRIRAEFIKLLRQFFETLDLVMPRPEALPYLRDAKILGFINKAAGNLYRDPQLNVAGVGHKVQKLIDEHIMAQGIDPKVPPISIMDADFEAKVDTHVSPRAKASEMEHAARHYISERFQEDPAYYKKLSEHLEQILRDFQDNWTELVRALRQYTQEVRRGRPGDDTGVDPRTQAPFLGILLEEVENSGQSANEQMPRLIEATVDVVDHIRQEVRLVDFWRNAHAQSVLRGWIIRYLDDHDLVPLKRQAGVADRMVALAKALHTSLARD